MKPGNSTSRKKMYNYIIIVGRFFDSSVFYIDTFKRVYTSGKKTVGRAVECLLRIACTHKLSLFIMSVPEVVYCPKAINHRVLKMIFSGAA